MVFNLCDKEPQLTYWKNSDRKTNRTVCAFAARVR